MLDLPYTNNCELLPEARTTSNSYDVLISEKINSQCYNMIEKRTTTGIKLFIWINVSLI